MREHGGKMYYARNTLVQADKAGYMPDFEGSDVNKKTIHTTDALLGKITLMSFVYAKYGETHVNSFIDPFLAKFKDTDAVQTFEVINIKKIYSDGDNNNTKIKYLDINTLFIISLFIY